MSFTFAALAIAAVLLVAMLVLVDVGRRIGARRLARDTEGARAGVGVVEGSVFGLLGLLLAFTFSGAASRFDGMAGGRTRNWIHMMGYAATIAVAIYVILDLEYPRLGLIRVDQFDQALVELRASMK
jgi:hypothetical protein